MGEKKIEAKSLEGCQNCEDKKVQVLQEEHHPKQTDVEEPKLEEPHNVEEQRLDEVHEVEEQNLKETENLEEQKLQENNGLLDVDDENSLETDNEQLTASSLTDKIVGSKDDHPLSLQLSDDKEEQIDSKKIENMSNKSNQHNSGNMLENDSRHTTTCAICLLDYEEGVSTLTLSQCSHMFHFDCAMAWFVKNDHCPYCRNEVMTSDAMQDAALKVLGKNRFKQICPQYSLDRRGRRRVQEESPTISERQPPLSVEPGGGAGAGADEDLEIGRNDNTTVVDNNRCSRGNEDITTTPTIAAIPLQQHQYIAAE